MKPNSHFILKNAEQSKSDRSALVFLYADICIEGIIILSLIFAVFVNRLFNILDYTLSDDNSVIFLFKGNFTRKLSSALFTQKGSNKTFVFYFPICLSCSLPSASIAIKAHTAFINLRIINICNKMIFIQQSVIKFVSRCIFDKIVYRIILDKCFIHFNVSSASAYARCCSSTSKLIASISAHTDNPS